MNSSSQKQQLNPRSIYATLAGGFVLLLSLIFVIGLLSTRRLEEISITADKTANEYKERLAVALSIREAAAEVIAETRVYRTRSVLRVPAPRSPFRAELSNAKQRFQEEMEKGKRLWGRHKENLSPEEKKEMDAWRKVEGAAQKFWDKLIEIENAPLDESTSKEGSQLGPGKPDQQLQANIGNVAQQQAQLAAEQSAKREAQFKEDNFFTLRKELDQAAENLSTAVLQVQDEILNRIVAGQQNAASDISRFRWFTLMFGLVVAGLTFGIVRQRIKQQREAYRLEQEAKGFANSVFHSQSNGIIVVNQKGELLDVNQAFRNQFKLSAPSLVLQDYAAALAHLPEIAAFIKKALDDPNDRASHRERIEVRPRHNLGDPKAVADTRLFDVYVSPLTVGGQTNGRVIMLVDVTEAEKVREELRRSRALSAVGQITATVAHELYNPIGAVKLNIDLLEMQISGDDDVKHTVARLKRGVEHLSTIVMDLRYLTRPREPERKPTDLNKLLDEVVELAGDRLERSRVYVSRKYAPRLPQGQFDPQQLRKVFLNLLINAVEASQQNSDVELHTRYISATGAPVTAESNGRQGALIISVIDHGVGMSQETKRRLFEAFYTTKRNGTGLGMMITQEIVKKHGGKIEVESEEGKGTTVNVYLPV
jgi:signal transduction histidine kinase